MRLADLPMLEHIAAEIGPYIHRTPTVRSRLLSEFIGCNVHLKQELFQKTGSYKPRGMLWALMCLSAAQRARGVITFSAGNAAQGLAYAAGLLGISATVVMPESASAAKAQATRDYGAEVIKQGGATDCLDLCRALAAERDLAFISSYDDPDLINGHATLGFELIEDVPSASAIFVGIGGGGMAGGLAVAKRAMDRSIRLIGVEPDGAPAMSRSLAEGHPVRLATVETIADGLAAPSAGDHGYALVRDHFEDVMVVPDRAIVNAMILLMTRAKLFVEPAGAAALSGLIARKGEFSSNEHVICVVSGGNMDLARLKALL